MHISHCGPRQVVKRRKWWLKEDNYSSKLKSCNNRKIIKNNDQAIIVYHGREPWALKYRFRLFSCRQSNAPRWCETCTLVSLLCCFNTVQQGRFTSPQFAGSLNCLCIETCFSVRLKRRCWLRGACPERLKCDKKRETWQVLWHYIFFYGYVLCQYSTYSVQYVVCHIMVKRSDVVD